MEHTLIAPRTAGVGYDFEVATIYEHSSIWFMTLLQALDHLNNLEEKAAVYDYSIGWGELVTTN